MNPTTEAPGDEALLGHFALTNDSLALDELARRHWALAYRIALRALGDPATAEDAAQEAFVALVRNARAFDPARPFGPWFRTLVVNAARNGSRSRRRRARLEERLAAEQARARSARPAATADLVAELETHLRRLPEDQRFAIVLHYYEGCSHHEVADAIGIPRGSVNGRIQKGLERLRETLAGAGSLAVAMDLEPFLALGRDGNATLPVPPAPGAARLLAAARAAGLAAFAVKLVVGLVALGVVGLGLGVLWNAPGAAPAGPIAGKAPAIAPLESDTRAASPAPVEPAPVEPAPVTSADAPTPASASPAPAPEPAVTGTKAPVCPVAGLVLDAATLAPIQGAAVYASKQTRFAGDDSTRTHWSSRLGADDRTGASGQFRLELEPGSWEERADGSREYPTIVHVTLVVLAPGHEPFVRTFSPERLGAPLTILLDAGRGRAVRGAVVDKRTRAPLPDVKLDVSVSLDHEARARGRLEGESAAPDEVVEGGSCQPQAASGADGSFRLDGLPAGEARIRIARGQALGEVGVSSETAVEPAEVVLEVSRAATLTVEVLNAAGEPETDAHVEVSPGDQTFGGTSCPAYWKGKPSRFASLDPGSYAVRVGLPHEEEPAAERSEAARLRMGRSPDVVESVTLEPGEQRTLTIRAKAGAGAKGRSPVTCTVHFESGAAAEGVELWVVKGTATDWLARAEATTDAGGVARFPGLEAGAWKLQASAGASAPPLRTFDVGANPVVLDLTIPDRAPVRGVVRDAAGEPVAGARVHFQEAWNGGASRDALTRADGTFALAPLTKGALYGLVEAAGYERLHADVDNDGHELTLTLTRGRDLRVHGTVGAAARDGARVHAWLVSEDGNGGGGGSGKVVGSVATVSWKSLPSQASFTLVLRVEGFVPTRHPITANVSDVDLGSLVLDPGHVLRGHVADPEGYLKKGAFSSVSLEGASFDQVHDTSLAPDGSFVVDGVPDGAATLRIALAVPGVGSKDWLEAEVPVDAAALERGDLGLVPLSPRPK